MAKQNGVTADKMGGMFPAGEDIELPGERTAKKKGGKGKWIALAVGVGVLGGVGTHVALNKKDVTPANYPAEPIVDTRPVLKTPDIPEPLKKGNARSVYPAENTSMQPDIKDVAKNPAEIYPEVSEREVDSFMDRFELPDNERDVYRVVLNDISGIVKKKGRYIRHETKEVFDGPHSKGLPQDKVIIVYSWHSSKSGKESILRWHFSPNSPSEHEKWGIFYKYGKAPR